MDIGPHEAEIKKVSYNVGYV